MSILLELPPEIESRLNRAAEEKGLKAVEFVLDLLERSLPPSEIDIKAFLALPRTEQDRVLAAAAEDAASLYNADLALPPSERELTAFIALDGESSIYKKEQRC